MFESIQSPLHRTVREFYFSSGKSSVKTAGRAILSTLVPLYVIGRRIHQTYRILNRTGVSIPVVSVGNLSLGGTGKTPWVGWLVEQLLRRDIQPAVLKRGEGRIQGIVPKGSRDLPGLAEKYGDEATIVRCRFPRVPLRVGKDRVNHAKSLSHDGSVDVILIDDGFQYRLLERNLDVVLLRKNDMINNWQLPAGPLREPLGALERADVVSLYGGDDRAGEFFDKIPQGVQRVSHRYEFDGIVRDGEDVTEAFRGRECYLVSTLARPEELERFLRDAGFILGDRLTGPDHSDPSELVRRALDGTNWVLVTPKEWVKLNPSLRNHVGVIKSQLQVEPSDVILQALEREVTG